MKVYESSFDGTYFICSTTNKDLFKGEVTIVIGDTQLTSKDIQALTKRKASNCFILKYKMNSTEIMGINLQLNYSFTIKESTLGKTLIENVLKGKKIQFC